MISKVAKNTAIITKDASSALDLVIDGFASRKRLQQACGFEVSLSTLLRSPFHCRYARLEPRLGYHAFLNNVANFTNGGLDTPNSFHILMRLDNWHERGIWSRSNTDWVVLFPCYWWFVCLFNEYSRRPCSKRSSASMMCATQIDDVNANRNCISAYKSYHGNRPTLLLLIYFSENYDVDHSVNNGLGIKKTSILFSKNLLGAKFDDDI